MKVNGNLTLNALGQSQIENAILDRVSSLPTFAAAEKGRIVFLTSDSQYYFNDGAKWQPFATGGSTGEIDGKIGDLANLTTTDKSTIVGAINEVKQGVTDVTTEVNNSLGDKSTLHTTAKSTFVAAINELADEAAFAKQSVQYAVLAAGDLVGFTAGATKDQRVVVAGDKVLVAATGVVVTVPASGAPDVGTGTAVSTGNTVVAVEFSDTVKAGFVVLNKQSDGTVFWSVVSLSDSKQHAFRTATEQITVFDKLSQIGVLSTLTTTEKSTVVGALNELDASKQDLNSKLTDISNANVTENSILVGTAAGGLTVDSGAGARDRLGVAIGRDVQAYDADLTQLAGLTPVVGDVLVAVGTAEGSRWGVKNNADFRDTIGLGDVATHDDAEYVRVDGTNAMTADLNVASHKIINLATPTVAGDAVNKAYVDNIAAGLTWAAPVDAVVSTSTEVNQLSTEFPTAVDGFRVGDFSNKLGAKSIYVKAGATWNAVAPVDGTAVFDRVTETGYVFSGTDWVQFTGGGQLTAGVGLVKTGNVLDVNLGAGIAELPSDGVGIDLHDAATSALILTEDGAARSTSSNARLHLLLDQTGTGALSQSAQGLKVGAAQVSPTELAATVAGDGLVGGAGTALAVGASAGVAGTLGEIVVAADGIGVKLGTTSTTAAAGNHTHVIADVTGLQTALDALDTATDQVAAELDVLETSVGVNVDGTLPAFTATNLSSATTVVGALNTLGTAIGNASSAVANGYVEYTSTVASTTHTITHNRGIKFWNVTVIDSTDEVVIPQGIRFVNANTFEVTFNVAINCTVIAHGRLTPSN